jgi:hypothetical protein
MELTNIQARASVDARPIVSPFDASYEDAYKYLIDVETQIGQSASDCVIWTSSCDNVTTTETKSSSHDAFGYVRGLGKLFAGVADNRMEKYVTETWFNVSPISASGQMPVLVIAIEPKVSNPDVETGSFNVGATVGHGNRGLALPRVHGEWLPLLRMKSLGEIAEPYIRYFRELEGIMEQLRVRRGTDSQEHFMFDVVAPFIIRNGATAIRDIDISLESMPSSARYSFPYLLGHLITDDRSILRTRFAYLSKYMNSSDFDIREGALEALDHLNAA